MTVFSTVVVVYTLFSSVVQCSSIITKSMIRMPNGSYYGSSRPVTSVSELPKPEMLKSRPSGSDLKEVHPHKSEGEQSISVEGGTVSEKTTSFEPPLAESFVQLSSPTVLPNTTKPISETHNQKMKARKDTTVSEDGLESLKDAVKNLSSSISPKELSSMYWLQYKNFSHDFFNKWSAQRKPQNELKTDKQYPGNSILTMFQRIFSCFWTSELFTCVQDGLDEFSLESFPFFHLMSPRLPRIPLEDGADEGFTSRNDDFEYSMAEEDEGRKKLSKRLLQLIPFLMMLKMTMLPALAVMALVSGKAFLMSLLSLGVALVATFSSAVPFRADKRHEISPQSIHPNEQLPGKYYYAM